MTISWRATGIRFDRLTPYLNPIENSYAQSGPYDFYLSENRIATERRTAVPTLLRYQGIVSRSCPNCPRSKKLRQPREGNRIAHMISAIFYGSRHNWDCHRLTIPTMLPDQNCPPPPPPTTCLLTSLNCLLVLKRARLYRVWTLFWITWLWGIGRHSRSRAYKRLHRESQRT